MRGLLWLVGVVVVAIGVYLASPPRWAGEATGAASQAARSDSRSLVVRLAKAGQAMRERDVRPAGAVEEMGENSFGAR